ncbi:MAG: hypothetical protein AAGJ82_01805 [Bacteroidota bacterium]
MNLRQFFQRSLPETKHLYLLGWEAKFDGSQQCYNFIATQAIDQSSVKEVDIALELIFKGDRLAEAYEYDEGIRQQRPLSKVELGLPYPKDVIIHSLYEIKRSYFYESYIGGKCPDHFSIPALRLAAPFQYLGKIGQAEDAFSWLPFDLHLTAPIYLNIKGVFLDYTDPLAPVVHNAEALSAADHSLDDLLQPDTIVEFEQTKISFEHYKKTDDDLLGSAGVPRWVQYPTIPTCPKSGKVMRFVCQLGSFGNIQTQYTNADPAHEYYREIKDLNFWGDGDLFIFFEPESKMVYYLIQHT